MGAVRLSSAGDGDTGCGPGAGPRCWRPRARRVQIVRSLLLAACNLLYALALRHVPLAECTAINFVGPVITVALAGVWLHEYVGWRRWAGVAAGLAGTLIVLRPGTGVGASGTVCSRSVRPAFMRFTRSDAAAGRSGQRADDDRADRLMGDARDLAGDAVRVGVAELARLAADALLGGLGGFGHYLLVLAYNRAPASLLAPMGYAGMIVAVLYGIGLFGEIPGSGDHRRRPGHRRRRVAGCVGGDTTVPGATSGRCLTFIIVACLARRGGGV